MSIEASSAAAAAAAAAAADSSASPALTQSLSLSNGQSMPVLGLGTWRSDKGKVAEAVYVALKAGYRHLDCAAVYENEGEVGEGLSRAIKEGVCRREDVFIVSKLWNTEQRAERVRPALEKTLSLLGVAYLDLYLVHWPTALQPGGALFPRDETTGAVLTDTVDFTLTWRALEDCLDAGLTRALGISNFNIDETKSLLAHCRVRPVVNQVEAHPYFQQAELAAFCKSEGIAITAYSPLGNINPADESTPSPLKDPVVQVVAEKHGKSPAQILIRWSIQRGYICIPKSVTPSRVIDNAAVFDFTLTPADMAAVDSLGARNLRYVNPPFRAGGAKTFPV